MIENNKQTQSKMAFEAKNFMNRAFEIKKPSPVTLLDMNI